MTDQISAGVLDEYRRIQQWLERQAALLGPVGDTMHGLAAEALARLIEREHSRLMGRKLRSELSEGDGLTWEQVRRDRGWPTPNAMRQAATAIDELAIPRYGDILRFVADLCDDPRIPVGYTRRPLPTEEEIERLAAARGLVSETTIGLTPSTREVLRLGFMSGARAVLALLTKGQDR